MAGHINLGDNSYVAFGSVAHYLASLLLSIVARNRHAVVLARLRSRDCARTLRANLGKQRIFLYLDAPSLVLGEVPMEVVDVVHREDVDEFLQIVDAEEVSAAVDHERAVGEARRIGYLHSRQEHLLLAFHDRQRLHHGLHSVEHASMSCAVDGDHLLRHIEAVGLFAAIHICNGKANLVVGLACCERNVDASEFLNVRSEELSVAFLLSVAVGVEYACLLAEHKRLCIDSSHLLR